MLTIFLNLDFLIIDRVSNVCVKEAKAEKLFMIINYDDAYNLLLLQLRSRAVISRENKFLNF